MLRDIPPILSPDLLWSLAAMGHGDTVVIADANFPAEGLGPRCHRLDGVSATDALRAVLKLLPLDTFVEEPAFTMQVVGDPQAVPEIVAEFQQIVNATADAPAKLGSCERFAFYEAARQAFAVVQTGEFRLYGNIILTKGVIGG
ncbi:RbsD/FucU family protein [Algicella marina]|uniref:Ribose ABC transporter n=1 Tax=Algicella marina TaxID=2683284 RepID=A0A6P1T074_9RHOB|nr:RbsD/FucU domain-containing protein [Algicella marina]QHQ35121.1 ribose ABC transporter [Algicella marina]